MLVICQIPINQILVICLGLLAPDTLRSQHPAVNFSLTIYHPTWCWSLPASRALWTHCCGSPGLLAIDWSWWSQARLRWSHWGVWQWFSSIMAFWWGEHLDLIVMLPFLTINQTTIWLALDCLQPTKPGYSEIQHPAVSKEVTIWAKENPLWGHVGTAKSHNLIFNTFQVVFPTPIVTFYAQELWLK